MSWFEEFEEPSFAEDLAYMDNGDVKVKTRKDSPFSRGYQVAREKTEQGSKFIRSCFNCAYYGSESMKKKEVCQNPDVTKYDVIVEGNMVYCTQWRPYTDGLKEKNNSLFRSRKTGRARLE